ncbi:MAG: M1 family metallopeptidase [Actinomycetota bacterium]
MERPPRPAYRRALIPAVSAVTAISLGLASLPAEPASAGAPVVRTPGEPRYRFDLRSGTAGRSWTGSGSISFANTDGDPLPVVYLRLWSNGVRGCGARSITVSGLTGGTFTGERLDCTELEVALDAPLDGGERATIGFRLRIRLPDEDDRFGFHRGLALLGTALPTLAVHDDAGWHPAPFENLGESFYSVTGRYTVTLDTPALLSTAATGVVTRSRATGDRVRTTYSARGVRDFAWAAGRLRRVVRWGGGTRVVVSYQPGAVARARAVRSAVDAARVLRTLGDAFGGYPYPEVDVVLAGFASFGGMEYPTIVFAEPSRATLAHELVHQWFYGAVGNDQYREPWLDESFATWAARLAFGPRSGCRSVSWPSPRARLTNDMAYWAAHPGQYWLVYEGGSCMLSDLSTRFGHRRFLRIVGRYARRHHLGIARTGDFTAAVEGAAARHLPGFDAASYWAAWRVDAA